MARTRLIGQRSYHIEVEAVVNLLSSRQRGSIVTYAELEEILKINRRDEETAGVWQAILSRARDKYLKKTGIATRCVKNVGYKLMLGDDQMNDQSHERSAARKIRRGGTEKLLIHADELTESERNRQAAIVHQATVTLDVMKKHDAEKKSFLASTEAVNLYNRSNNVKPVATISRFTGTSGSEQQQPPA